MEVRRNGVEVKDTIQVMLRKLEGNRNLYTHPWGTIADVF